MSLRLEMLQVARLAPKALGDATERVRDFLLKQLGPGGGGLDRAGGEDLYYTIFVLGGLQALQAEIPAELVATGLRRFGDGETLDFVHLGALARCWSVVGLEPLAMRAAILERLEEFRTADGGYDAERGAACGNAYGCFVALGAFQDLGALMPEPLRMVHCLKLLETPDGAWGNARGLRAGAVPATAAAVAVLHQLGLPLNPAVGDWLLSQVHAQGGFCAVPGAPLPDLLSTATALHALAILERPLGPAAHEQTLDFLDSLWNAEGGFYGHWADDHLDAEYTFYGLLALGHLAVGPERLS